jgi:hypothetical protein
VSLPPLSPVGVLLEGIARGRRYVLDAQRLKAADAAAKRRKVSRSELIREALREHLARLRTLEPEERDCRGYEAGAAATLEVS